MRHIWNKSVQMSPIALACCTFRRKLYRPVASNKWQSAARLFTKWTFASLLLQSDLRPFWKTNFQAKKKIIISFQICPIRALQHYAQIGFTAVSTNKIVELWSGLLKLDLNVLASTVEVIFTEDVGYIPTASFIEEVNSYSYFYSQIFHRRILRTLLIVFQQYFRDLSPIICRWLNAKSTSKATSLKTNVRCKVQ